MLVLPPLESLAMRLPLAFRSMASLTWLGSIALLVRSPLLVLAEGGAGVEELRDLNDPRVSDPLAKLS